MLCQVQKGLGKLEMVQSRPARMLKELESMTYEEAVKEFSVLSLSFWRGKKKKKTAIELGGKT